MKKEKQNVSDDIPVELLSQIFDYDKEGFLVWSKNRPRSTFNTDRGYNHYFFNSCGKRAGSLSKRGYRYVEINGKPYKCSRLIFALCNRKYPEGLVDHVNGVRHDDRIENLRDVDRFENMRNKKMYSSNSTSCTGVYIVGDKFRAKINHKGDAIHLGYFKTFEDAVIARKEAEVLYGYHQNHGRSK